MYFTIFFAGLAILLSFRIVGFLLRVVPFSRSFRKYTGYLLPVVELVFWVGWFIWAVEQMYTAFNYTALLIIGLLLVILVVPVWFLMRDFLYGVVLKLQRRIDVGGTIEIDDIKGKVVRAGHLSFGLKTREGRIADIPYSKVVSKVISRQGTNIHLISRTIKVQLPSAQNAETIKSTLKETLLNAPWVAATQEPIIKRINRTENGFEAEVIVHLLKKEHAGNVKNYIKLRFQQA